MPVTTSELEVTWKASPLYAQLMAPAASAPTLTLESDFARAQYGAPFVHTAWQHTTALLARQFMVMRRNKLFVGFRMFSSLLMSIIFGGMVPPLCCWVFVGWMCVVWIE